MVRGPKKHLKRMFAPSHWMLDKLSGVYAPKPSPGPHKSRECLPLAIILRNRLKYALNMTEVVKILNQKDGNVKVDGKVRKDAKYPAGFMDVITIEKTGDLFRLLYDVKGRFTLTKIDAKEAEFKLCRIKKRLVGTNQVPYVVTHDGRTIRFPHPEIHANDSVKVNLKTGEIEEWIKFDVGNLTMVTAGNNIGRVGIITHKEKHIGGFDIYHLKDARGHSFATRINNVFIIGQGKKPMITLPKQKGIKLTTLEEQTQKFHEA